MVVGALFLPKERRPAESIGGQLLFPGKKRAPTIMAPREIDR